MVQSSTGQNFITKCTGIAGGRGRVFQSIISLTSSLRAQLVKTLLPNALIFFIEKMREAFALQKLLTFFSTKNTGVYLILMLEMLMKLTNNVVSFEQLDPDPSSISFLSVQF